MVISRIIIRVTPFRALITLLITYLLSPLPLQVEASTLDLEPLTPKHKHSKPQIPNSKPRLLHSQTKTARLWAMDVATYCFLVRSRVKISKITGSAFMDLVLY